jgi:hypothetical protein
MWLRWLWKGCRRYTRNLARFMAGKANQPTNQVSDSAMPRLKTAHRPYWEGRSVVVSGHSAYR